MTELMNNPYAWLALSICTVASLIFAIYTWIIGRKTREISINYFSNDIIKKGKQPIPKLNIEFDGKRIQDLTSTTFYIWNSGNDVINCEDLVEKKLKIGCASESILDIQVIKQSDNSNHFLVSNTTSTEAEITFDYMNSGEGVSVQVLHTGSGADLFFNCKIKGGKPIRDCCQLKKRSGVRGLLCDLIAELWPMSIFAAVSFAIAAVCRLTGIPHKEYGGWLLAISAVLSILAILLCSKMLKRAKRALHRTIPSALKMM